MVFPEYGLTGAALSEEPDRGRARQFMARDMEVGGELVRATCN